MTIFQVLQILKRAGKKRRKGEDKAWKERKKETNENKTDVRKKNMLSCNVRFKAVPLSILSIYPVLLTIFFKNPPYNTIYRKKLEI